VEILRSALAADRAFVPLLSLFISVEGKRGACGFRHRAIRFFPSVLSVPT
jgi:hypothetical protein